MIWLIVSFILGYIARGFMDKVQGEDFGSEE